MKTIISIALACSGLWLTGCGGLTKGKVAAETAIAHFHEQYNDGKIDAIWDGAHPKFRSASKKEKYDEFLRAVQSKLGKVTSTANVNWNVGKFNLTTTVKMAQKTVFEKGEGTESFAFEMDGEKAVLVGYNIQSMDLITK
jgi:hypothetical protein